MNLKLKVGKVVRAVDIESVDAVFEDVGKIVSESEGYVLSTVVFVHKGKRYRLSSASEAQTKLTDAGMWTSCCGAFFRCLRGLARSTAAASLLAALSLPACVLLCQGIRVLLPTNNIYVCCI